MHEHVPITAKNMILRCLAFLGSPIELFRYYTDGSDICSQCGAAIALPDAYYSPLSSALYFLAGIGIGLVMSILPFLRPIIATILTVVFHHMFSAIVLGCFPWVVFDPSVRSTQAFNEDAKKELAKKFICHMAGVLIYCVLYVL